ncbi:hypothetical protein CIHG_06247 [Coccidioides immitis H538.4]|uniref:Uncharacterized protein n=3 Tax=Coccidioides immitis TaxID=5501 RepID=A0A0J8QRG2_COCIT|nr:hypothetical protein CIRG_09522 [Coccidioides immitis RMSCC 2394]KMU75289.1 hypothetical protein CISG_04708 [Coccidioides immitis RMSCC 3703]KMU88447.1 hypothetical protein CIHG_06247 [Coccidioides immitis H538.4]
MVHSRHSRKKETRYIGPETSRRLHNPTSAPATLLSNLSRAVPNAPEFPASLGTGICMIGGWSDAHGYIAGDRVWVDKTEQHRSSFLTQ